MTKKAELNFSRGAILSPDFTLKDPDRTQERALVIQECVAMLGSPKVMHFAAKLHDDWQQELAGQCDSEKGITVSLRAEKLDLTARHEMWHFADKNFLFYNEKIVVRYAFRLGSFLNLETQKALDAMGHHDAARQCESEDECAAYAFSLWCENRLDVNDNRVNSLFDAFMAMFATIADWLEEKVYGIRTPTVEDIFNTMRSGELALRWENRDNPQDSHASPTP